MTTSIVRATLFIAAYFALYLSMLMLIPAAVDLYVGNPDWQIFAISAFSVAGLALATIFATQAPPPPPSSRLAFLVVNALWLTLSLVGALPLYMSSLDISFIEALFEGVSGATTTGSTVLVGLDDLPPGLLLWRSILQWMGGVGVIALGVFILPYLNIGGFSFFRIESSDIEDRPFARFSTFSVSILMIYTALTALCALFYVMGGMSVFDAVNHSMTTLATAGFSTHDASFGHFADQPMLLWTAIVFMIIGGLPFTVLVLFAFRGQTEAARDPQITLFLCLIAGAAFAVTIWLIVYQDWSFFRALTHALFNIVSIITTTGYASDDYTSWGPFAVVLFFAATWLGGCSGSTSGGTKPYRFLILWQLLRTGLQRLLFPKIVTPIRYGGRLVSTDMQAAVLLFVSTSLVLWIVLSVALAAMGLDLVTALSGSLTALMNVGPAFGPIIGPAGNFGALSDGALLVLIFGMLLGRLEILTVLVLFSPLFWRR
ncbi:TrkH family potassium uptake protein [Notoacmeibacter marinus]|uniref:TrkH family potassium uptake protein n=1 Tax=Notoacmeibacter marinus TaxID=1876515 RepID=UPI001966BBFE|nr:TrkH family potassium uptake protein [Notoacmeibacter marinus]